MRVYVSGTILVDVAAAAAAGLQLHTLSKEGIPGPLGS